MPEAPTPSMVYDVIEACADPGCPLCRVSLRWGGRFMAAILYQEVTHRIRVAGSSSHLAFVMSTPGRLPMWGAHCWGSPLFPTVAS